MECQVFGLVLYVFLIQGTTASDFVKDDLQKIKVLYKSGNTGFKLIPVCESNNQLNGFVRLLRISATFHFKCFHIIFCSLWVTERPPFGK